MSFNYSPKIVTDGLVLCLDAGNPNSYPGSGTTWKDLSRGRNNGTLVNGPTFSGENSGTLVFDGVDDYIGLTPISIVPNEGTIEAWFKTSIEHRGAILGFGDGGVNNWGTFEIGNGSSGYDNEYFSYINITGTSSERIAIMARDPNGNSFKLSDGDYHQIVATISNVEKKLYVDSKEVSFSYLIGNEESTNCFLNKSDITMLKIGDSTYNGGHIPFIGNIPSVKIYNRVLSSQEIQQNFNATRSRFGI